MNKCISIFPETNIDDFKLKWQQYIELASKYNFTEVFTTIHLPELPLEKQIKSLLVISKLTKQYQMDLIVDVGGLYLKKFLDSQELFEQIKEAKIDFVRLDYGYNQSDVIKLNKELNPKGFMINASMYSEKEVDEKVEFFRSLDNVEIRACHNFYPREESGLNKKFALKQDAMFKKYNIPVYYFIPSLKKSRGPVFKGLPTIEKHRYNDVILTTLELLYIYKTDSFMFSDQFYDEESFKQFNDVINHKPLEIKVDLLNDKYDDIVLQTHEFRYDSNKEFLRSRSSRQMSQYASVVAVDNNVKRLKGSITIDNKLYGRYSGELQVVLKDNKKDKRVNVVGKVDKKDLEKFLYYNYGYTYKFVKK